MKKLVVMLLAVAMTVGFVSSAMAADLSWWMGGDMYYFYTTADGDRGLNDATGLFTVDSLLTAQVTEGNSWAKTWVVRDTWNDTALHYAFGYNKIGGILDLGFSSKDTGIANMGQAALGEFFNDFKSDPVFNTYDMGGAVSAVITTENFKLNMEYVHFTAASWAGWVNPVNDPANNTGDNRDKTFAVSGLFKIENGDIHFGYKRTESSDDYLGLLGANFAVGSAAVKVDLWLNDDNTVGAFGEVGAPIGGEKLQANVAFEKWDVTLFYGNGEVSDDDMIALGANFKATDKLTIGAKIFDIDAADMTIWELYGLYDLGAFDVKFGLIDDESKNDDVVAVLGFHASIW